MILFGATTVIKNKDHINVEHTLEITYLATEDVVLMLCAFYCISVAPSLSVTFIQYNSYSENDSGYQTLNYW